MFSVLDLPCIRSRAEEKVDSEYVSAREPSTAKSGLAQAAASVYPSKSLALQDGQYRVTDSEK